MSFFLAQPHPILASDRFGSRPIGPILRLATIFGTLWASFGVGLAEEVRVYTNADLEKYAVQASSGSTDSPASRTLETDDDWEFVTEFIAREQARIQVERKDELARQALEADLDARAATYSADEEWRYRPIYRPWRGLFDRVPARIGGFRNGKRHDGRPDRPPQDAPPGDASKNDPARHDRIVPIHAR